MHDEWFVDEEHVRKAVGFLEKPVEMMNAREVCYSPSSIVSWDNLGLDVNLFLISQLHW